jgi:hypothetical protein
LGPGSASGSTVSVTLDSTSPTIALGLIGLGVVVIIIGVVLKRRPSAPSSPPTAARARAESTDEPSPPGGQDDLPEGEFADHDR